jgi:hypothetical protein
LISDTHLPSIQWFSSPPDGWTVTIGQRIGKNLTSAIVTHGIHLFSIACGFDENLKLSGYLSVCRPPFESPRLPALSKVLLFSSPESKDEGGHPLEIFHLDAFRE